VTEYANSPDFRPILASLGSLAERRNAWLGGREDSNLDMANSKPDALACPRGFAEPHFIGIHKQLETLEFREPYRIRGVQSSGENWAIRRRMVGLCRLEIRNSNRKSLLILGLIANILAQRTGGCSEAGGGRGTGIEPSPLIPEQSRGPRRTRLQKRGAVGTLWRPFRTSLWGRVVADLQTRSADCPPGLTAPSKALRGSAIVQNGGRAALSLLLGKAECIVPGARRAAKQLVVFAGEL
jgi:hypothetical protein